MIKETNCTYYRKCSIQIKLLSENKLIICALGNLLAQIFLQRSDNVNVVVIHFPPSCSVQKDCQEKALLSEQSFIAKHASESFSSHSQLSFHIHACKLLQKPYRTMYHIPSQRLCMFSDFVQYLISVWRNYPFLKQDSFNEKLMSSALSLSLYVEYL